MKRREAIKVLGALAAYAFIPSASDDDYQPVGYLAVGMPLAPRVISVTVDGVEQFPRKVLRGDDIDGWIEVFSESEHGKKYPDASGRLAKEIRRGVVRFTFRPEGL